MHCNTVPKSQAVFFFEHESNLTKVRGFGERVSAADYEQSEKTTKDSSEQRVCRKATRRGRYSRWCSPYPNDNQQTLEPGKITEHTQNTNSKTPETLQPPFGLSWLQATQILNIFRQEYTSQFPFVLIRSDVTAESLYKGNPFLFRAVMLVAAPLSEPRIIKMKRNVLAYLGYRTLVEEDKTLDILQVTKPILICQAVNLACLGLGYAHNLGITQDTSLSSGPHINTKDSYIAVLDPKEDADSMEKKRTLLGIYCVLSILSTRQSRTNPLQTPYINGCLKSFSETQDSPSDSVAEHMVRLIQMSERLSEGFGDPYERTLSRPFAFLLEGTGRRFHSDLSRLSESVAYPNLASRSQIFELHRLYLLVRLYEPAIIVACHPDEGVAQFYYLLICLRNCLEAMQSFFELLLGLPVEIVLRCSILTVDQALYVMLQASRLLLIETHEWDVESARQTLDLSAVLGRVIARFEEAEELRKKEIRNFVDGVREEESGGGVSSVTMVVKEVQWLKYWFEANTQGRQVGDASSVEANGDMSHNGAKPRWSVGLLEEMPWNITS
ncbi:hypothetical protein SNK03_003366 [Fusarium graminearum]|uniref:hypothetical protein n=1 Tax=Gibberella zeae (strain ATCC MYA-4620 / CBS 123657 / FGSC 9075 / NRRL 31084 / PH-1) TaxID=229533 RepID=UPI000023F46E|nr:hypothetical protein FGSG_10014 [Fusarium graminearum PH-1]ESU16676.1 hypothetical protein FGSG_10014 [Fusarium graminearum PH-1]|eukprot:XP_011318938.1 hypothetical protein FGSG_10014 [Fusarium graminearum PH-1]